MGKKCGLSSYEYSVEKPVRFARSKCVKPCCVSFSEGRVKLVPTSHVIGTVSLEMVFPTNTIVVLHLWHMCVCSVLSGGVVFS